jgi:hypothetical protein
VRIKGHPAALLHVQQGSRRELLERDDRVAPGDTLPSYARATNRTA